jgi:hypothetical protein
MILSRDLVCACTKKMINTPDLVIPASIPLHYTTYHTAAVMRLPAVSVHHYQAYISYIIS